MKLSIPTALTICFITLASVTSYAQDTLRVVTYNLLKYPSSTPQRADTLRKIVQYAKPDVMIVNELESLFGANTILNQAFNFGGITHYARANYVDGPDTDNMLYYNTQKVGLASQIQLSTTLRDISEYKIYYKTPDLATNPDTIFIYLYSCHLKAGSTVSDENSRNLEAQQLKVRLGFLNPSNCIVGGDFNIYRHTESAFGTITAANGYQLFDPINRIGNWHDNSLFSDVHTQSTQTTSYLGGSTGGLDDRFDWLFVNSQIVNGTAGVQYINGTYKAIGQDGLRINNSVTASPQNNSAPQSVIRALSYMSDHLPVYMELMVGREVSTNNIVVANDRFSLLNLNGEGFRLTKLTGDWDQILIYSISGQLLYSTKPTSDNFEFDGRSLDAGIYLVTVVENGTPHAFRFVRY